MRARRHSGHSTHSASFALALGAVLVTGGAASLAIAATGQRHAPQPIAAQAGSMGPARWPAEAAGRGVWQAASAPSLDKLAMALRARDRGLPGPVSARSVPVAIDIPAIDLKAKVGQVGLNRNGTMQVPPLYSTPSEAAWYRYSPPPGQLGASVIVGHVDNAYGPAVFFRLGALRPGDTIKVVLANRSVAAFTVDGVRRYPKAKFPTAAVYGPTNYPALRLVTCGGPFDSSTRHYLDNIIVFASLLSRHAR